MLTTSLKRVLQFIDQRIVETGRAPTYCEMSSALRHNGGGIHAQILQLEERGYIRRLPYKARGIEVIRKPVPSARYRYFRFDDITKELVPYDTKPAKQMQCAASPAQADGALTP